MLFKNALKTFTRTKSRFFSIFGIVAIGAGFFVGIKNSAPDMVLSAQTYFSEERLSHFRLVSTFGFSEKDIAALEKLDGITVYPEYFTDAIIESESGSDQVMRVLSLDGFGKSNDINRLSLVEGRFPEKADECVIDAGNAFSSRKLGDKITLVSGTDEPLSEKLSLTEYTVVGIFNSPMYIDKSSRGSTTIGNGTISGIVYVSGKNFLSDVYTEVYLCSERLSALSAYSAEYKAANDEITELLEQLGDSREIERHDEIITEAQAKLDDAQSELDTKKADAESELSKAKQELDNALLQLRDGETQLQQARTELDSAKKKLEQSRKELDEGQSAFAAAEKEYYDGILKAEVQIKQNELKLKDGKNQYLKAVDSYNEQLSEYNAQKKLYEQSLSEYEAQQAQYQLLLAFSGGAEEAGGMTAEQFLMLIGGVMPSAEEISAIGVQLEGARAELDAAAEQLSSGKTLLDDGKVQLDTEKLKLDAGEKELAAAKTQLSAAKKDGQKQLDESAQKLSDGEAAYNQGIEDYRAGEIQYAASVAELEKGRAEYDEGLSEYEKGKSEADTKIAEAEKEIRTARREMNELENPKWYISDRSANVGYQEYGENSERIDSISQIFPLFFLLVAALVCLTTMTRMVEEERVQIGTLKALGYKNSQIIFKYMLYAVSATVLGALSGMLAGQLFFPVTIMTAYRMLYTLPVLLTPINWPLGLGSAAVCAAAAALTVYSACSAELSEMPAQLMRPKTPKLGKSILLERLSVWNRLSFTKKVTARNLLRYKRRMLMTVVGVAGCTALTLMGFALRDSISDIVNKQYYELYKYDGLLAFNSSVPEEISDVKDIIAENGVSETYYQKKIIASANGASVDSTYLVVPENTVGFLHFFVLRDRKSHEMYSLEKGGVVIDEKLSNMLDVGVGDEISFSLGDTEQKTAVVSAITENYTYHYIYMDGSDYESLFGASPEYNMIAFEQDGEDTKIAEDALATRLLDEKCVLNVLYRDKLSESFQSMLRSLDAIIVILIASAGALAFVVLFNLTNINISERIREIATLKVLGFYDREVDSYIFRENMILTLMGTAVGLFGGKYLADFIVRSAEIDMVMFGRDIYPLSYIAAGIITVIFSVIVSIFMHRHLVRINMIDALKSVE